MDQYACEDTDRRREDTLAGHELNGIDVVEVDGGHPPLIPAQRTLLVHCLRAVPSGLRVQIAGGVRADPAINPVRVLWAFPAAELAAAHAGNPALVTQADVDAFAARPDAGHVLVVRTSSAGDFSTYCLGVLDPAQAGFDPRLATAAFTFKVDCPSDFDCRVAEVCPPERALEPTIDYLSRDYAGLRGLLLDRLSVVIPPWADRNVADIGVMLVEIFAYLGDYLADAQDAVSAEAYLGTARQRISVARHARLLDYPMHQGAAARAWIFAAADEGAEGIVLDTGHEVHSAGGSLVFHTLHPVELRSARNAIDIYTWSKQRCCLPRGATRATLAGTAAELGLHAGDVLIFEEVRGADGEETTADVTHRWPVRLSADPVSGTDPLTGTHVVDVTWYDQDALPFPLCLWRFPRGRCMPDVGAAVARGNVVLAEHGAKVGPEPLVPAVVPASGRYRPALSRPGLGYGGPYDNAAARLQPAASALVTAPEMALPKVVRLTDGRDDWTVQRDLLSSDRFEPDFVVEMTDDGRAYLRFGDDVLGRRPGPGDHFHATYLVGGGLAGNTGRDVLTQLVRPVAGVSVRNPLPASGGIDPEPVEQVRQWAPQAFRVQERAVTDADYAAVAQRDPRVQRAVATRRWTGSWYTEFITVDRADGAPVDAAFRAELAGFLERYRMAGYDFEVNAPVFVPLDIVLTICVAPGYFRGDVKRALDGLFSARDLPGGGRGFFHPDNFTFAQPVYLSRVVAAAMSVAGVGWVDTAAGPGSPNRFQRWGQPAAGELAADRIPMGPLEVARCDSDPNEPENGRIGFVMEGGL